MGPTFDEVKILLVPYEGNVEHMYLDTKGLVTVGIGNLLPSESAARALGFVSRTTKAKATPDEISADFKSVAKQKVGLRSRAYREFTKLDLPGLAIDELFRNRVNEFRSQLKKSYPKFEEYPNAVQLATLDMAFNLGVGGLKTKWPRLNAAIDAEDWAAAAENCVRPDAQPVRNAGTVALFEEAAE